MVAVAVLLSSFNHINAYALLGLLNVAQSSTVLFKVVRIWSQEHCRIDLLILSKSKTSGLLSGSRRAGWASLLSVRKPFGQAQEVTVVPEVRKTLRDDTEPRWPSQKPCLQDI